MLRAIAILLATLMAAVSFGQQGIAGGCQNGGTYPNCVGGEVVFTATGYSGQVRVRVTNAGGEVIDDADYTTSSGTLQFVENLSFADTYSVSINGRVVLTVTTR